MRACCRVEAGSALAPRRTGLPAGEPSRRDNKQLFAAFASPGATSALDFQLTVRELSLAGRQSFLSDSRQGCDRYSNNWSPSGLGIALEFVFFSSGDLIWIRSSHGPGQRGNSTELQGQSARCDPATGTSSPEVGTLLRGASIGAAGAIVALDGVGVDTTIGRSDDHKLWATSVEFWRVWPTGRRAENQFRRNDMRTCC